jgi:hypothetical protein
MPLIKRKSKPRPIEPVPVIEVKLVGAPDSPESHQRAAELVREDSQGRARTNRREPPKREAEANGGASVRRDSEE